MKPAQTYCQFCASLPDNTDNPNKAYHDTEYGVMVFDDNALFERLILEIFQAGLSWTIILKKRTAFQKAFANFQIDVVANFDENDQARLLENAEIVRNRLKIQATIYNAQQIQILQKEHGSFKNWLDKNRPLDKNNAKNEWIKLFKRHFKFVGGEIVGEFLKSLGYLAGAHDEDCAIGKKFISMNHQ